MVNCAVKYCRSRSEKTNLSADAISFFRFPKDIKTKLVWVKLMGNSHEWMPTTSSRVCSKHFEEGSYSISKCGRRILNPTEIPILHLPGNLNVAQKSTQTELTIDTCEKPLHCEQTIPEMDIKVELPSSPQLSISHSFSSETTVSDSGIYGKQYLTIYNDDSPQTRKMKCEIHRLSTIAEKRRKTIKRLQQINRRQKQKISNLKSVLDSITKMNTYDVMKSLFQQHYISYKKNSVLQTRSCQ